MVETSLLPILAGLLLPLAFSRTTYTLHFGLDEHNYHDGQLGTLLVRRARQMSTVLEQKPIRNVDTIRASGGVTNCANGLTGVTKNSSESGFYAGGNNMGTSLIQYFQSLTRKE